MKTWKLIVDREPLPGQWNMALDEVLFARAGELGETYLRFYRWDRPTASLGYSQDAARVIDLGYCRNHGIGVVRRITGGKLVLHDREVTYSVASSDVGAFSDTLRESYRRISLALMKGLEFLGLAAALAAASPEAYVRGTMPCFAFPARDEIEIGGKKIIGSAQKRTGCLFLQHGSVPLEKDEGLLAAVSAPGRTPETATGMTSLSEALGRPASFDEAVDALRRGFEAVFGVALEPLVLGPDGLEAAAGLRDSKYASEAWTLRSNSGTQY
jgi:lipoate-protein ligase A